MWYSLTSSSGSSSRPPMARTPSGRRLAPGRGRRRRGPARCRAGLRRARRWRRGRAGRRRGPWSRGWPEPLARRVEDHRIRLGGTEFTGDQHGVEEPAEPGVGELGVLVRPGRVGHGGERQTRRTQPVQAWQHVVEQPPGPGSSRRAGAAPSRRPRRRRGGCRGRRRTPWCGPAHLPVVEVARDDERDVLVGECLPERPQVVTTDHAVQRRAGGRGEVDERVVDVEADRHGFRRWCGW